MANFRHVTKCRGGSGGDLPSFLPVRCLMLKLVHSQISKPWECHLYFAQGCHLNFALTEKQRITGLLENSRHSSWKTLRRLEEFAFQQTSGDTSEGLTRYPPDARQV